MIFVVWVSLHPNKWVCVFLRVCFLVGLLLETKRKPRVFGGPYKDQLPKWVPNSETGAVQGCSWVFIFPNAFGAAPFCFGRKRRKLFQRQAAAVASKPKVGCGSCTGRPICPIWVRCQEENRIFWGVPYFDTAPYSLFALFANIPF